MLDKLRGAFPSGVNIIKIYESDQTFKNFKNIDKTRFYIYIDAQSASISELVRFFAGDIFTEKKPGVSINLKDYICELNISGEGEYIKIDCVIKTSQEQYLNPDIIIRALRADFIISDYYIQKIEMYDGYLKIFE